MPKPRRIVEVKEVIYNEDRWQLLENLRQLAEDVLRTLDKRKIAAIVHGSVARGDVSEDSDVDVVVTHNVSSFEVELAFKESGLRPTEREIVMATPWQLPKAHISLGENRIVSFPLVDPHRLEEEFYYFGGAVDLKQIESGERVPGVDKRLIFIEPTSQGHRKSPLVGREARVAKKLGISLEIVQERVQVLTRRDKVGRTGIFLQRKLAEDENLEAVFKRFVEQNPEVKRRVKRA